MPTPTAAQSSAPVHEFSCLYTRDIARKHKRWQDGILNFHTFNKRVMVYDSTRNFVGDAHWQASSDFEGVDEVILQNGIMVEVGERRGVTQTDLRPLFERKERDKEEPSSTDMKSSGMTGSDGLRSSASVRLTPSNGSSAQPPTRGPITQNPKPKHKSLSSILQRRQPGGVYGRASNPESPYDRRLRLTNDENQAEEERPMKKQKTSLRKFPGESTPNVVDLTYHVDASPKLCFKKEPLAKRSLGNPKTKPSNESPSSEISTATTSPSASRPSMSVEAKSSNFSRADPPVTKPTINPRAKPLILPKFNKRPKLVCMDSALQKMGISLPPKRVEPKKSLNETILSRSDSLDDMEEVRPANSRMKPETPISDPTKTGGFKQPSLPTKMTQKPKDPKPRTSLSAIGSPAASPHAKSSYVSLAAISPVHQLKARRTIPAATLKKSTRKRSAPAFDPVVHNLSEIQAQEADLGPWSIEAGDLFDWRPPDWEARRGNIASTVNCVD